jgi:hypothetical protein
MWNYLKSAFLVRVEVPQLGQVPANAMLVGAFAILGFAQPAFWLLGLAAEAVILPSLAFNPRFQNYIQARELQIAKDDDDAQRRGLIQILDFDARRRLQQLSAKCDRIINIFQTQQAEDYIVDTNRDALKSLQWVYLKLLVARRHLLEPAENDTESMIELKIANIDKELSQGDEPDSLRQSKAATQAILKKRLANIRRRQQTLEEIDSDLTRVEAQVDLILENATMQSKPHTISTDIELASDLLGAGVFGEDESAISDLDKKYAPQKSPTRETS